MKRILALSLLVMMQLGFATTGVANTITTVATVDSDAFPGVGTLSVEQDANGMASDLIFVNFENQTVKYTVDQLRQGPQVLANINGTDVTYLSLEPDFNPGTGGHGVFKFLNNGVNNIYLNFRFLIIINGNQFTLKSEPNLQDPSSDKNAYSNVFNHLFLKKKMFMGQMVGISAVVPSVK